MLLLVVPIGNPIGVGFCINQTEGINQKVSMIRPVSATLPQN